MNVSRSQFEESQESQLLILIFMTKTLPWPLKIYQHQMGEEAAFPFMLFDPTQCHLVLILLCLGCAAPQASGTLPVTPLMPSSCTKQPLGGVSRAQFLPSCTNLVVMANNLHFPRKLFEPLSSRPKRFVECEFFVGSFTLSGNCQGSKAFQLVGTSHSSHDFSSRLSSVGSDKSC